MLLTFGEIMLRLSSVDRLLIEQSVPGSFDTSFGGAESNVAFSYSRLGGKSAFLTALPDNQIAKAAVAQLRSESVDVSGIKYAKNSRMGIFFLETGANQRPSRVVYDRAGSAFAACEFDESDFERSLRGVQRLHITGITPALSRNCFEAAKKLAAAAFSNGVKFSCDLNFRNKLWKWKDGIPSKELARESMPEILQYADLVIGNEEDASDVLGISSGGNDFNSGKLDLDNYANIAREIASKFKSVKKVALTLRESVSADNNRWGAMMFDVSSDSAVYAPQADGGYSPYPIADIVDRVGGGDSFAAALIYALDVEKFASDSESLAFAVASSCLAHSMSGDYNYATRDDVVALMKGSVSGRVQR